MAPKSPWNTKATITTNASKNETPAAPPIQYGEAQSEEIEVLKAIFMEDYEEVEVKGAWSKTTDRSFKLKLKAFSDEHSFVVLSVRLTATYPRSAPLLEVQGLEGYHERTQKRVRNIVQSRPKQLLGEVMIHAIGNEIQDALEDAVQARQQGTLPSLEDERASAEEVTTALTKQAEEAEARRQQEAEEEEDRMLKRMVDEEISRREQRRPTKAEKDDTADEIEADLVVFDQPASLQIGGDSAHFSKLTIVSPLGQKRNEQSYLAKPHFNDSTVATLVAVKRLTLQRRREDVMELESLLARVQEMRHTGLLCVLAYRLDKQDGLKTQLTLCSEHADRGTLHNLLDLGSLHVATARRFSIELLEALDYLHRNSVAHGNLDTKRVVMVGNLPKLADFGYSRMLQDDTELSLKWRAAGDDGLSDTAQRKSDIWRFGVIASQMFLGVSIVVEFGSPQLMLGGLDLSDTFDDFMRKIFTVDARKRPSAFDLLPAEFLRKDGSVMDDAPLTTAHAHRTMQANGSAGFQSPAKRRSRHNSSNVIETMSRYANDFTEMGRLGKGGFGEVVKARNKLDGGIYAIKKIKQAPQLLDQVISEVMLLNRLNHPYVVRYFSTWVEENASGAVIDESTTETETATESVTEETSSDDGPRIDFGFQSAGGLDFVSSSGYPQIEFGNDSESDESSGEDGDDQDAASAALPGAPAKGVAKTFSNGALNLKKTRSDSQRPPSTLYIQMEYCERQTLRDLIRKTMTTDDSWRYIRQVTEGLAHIHGHGIIHRDLKPDNVFIDVAGNPKIGDFGLATTTQYHIDRAATMSGHSAGDMTRSVGTTLYVAPELRSASGGLYNDKVDMYSLGIIFYEMCEPFSTSMERIRALQQLREKDHVLPSAYHPGGDQTAQGKLVSCLTSHKPSERPSSTELLRSEILPVKIEDETIRQALSGLSDPRSPYHQKMMSALFAHDSVSTNRVKTMAWDARASGIAEDAKRLRLRGVARQTLEAIFRRHGAEEGRRQTVFPRSSYYNNSNVVQMLDASGNLLQLPYDLTLPHARQLARNSADVRSTFTFGNAYRDLFNGGPPRVNEEVDFDIVDGGDEDERTMNDAETLKIMDEVVSEMPLFATSTTVSLHLNHAAILTTVLDHCRVPTAQQPAVKEIISKLGFHQYTWSKVRVELRQFGLSDTALDDLQLFDFRDLPDKAFTRLQTLMIDTSIRLRKGLDAGIASLMEVIRVASLLSVRRKVYVAPLGSVNAKFFEDGILFQCVLERKSSRVVIAAGGRYDGLIRALRPSDSRSNAQGAVGVSIGLDPIITNMSKAGESSSKKAYLKYQGQVELTPKRCDVLVTAGGSSAMRDAGVKLITSFWANGVSAELATNRATPGKTYSFVVTLKHEASTTVKVEDTEAELEEADAPMSSLVTHLRQELRERESKRSSQPALLRQRSHQETDRKSNVQVLLARHGSKKSNKYQIVGDAQEQWSRKLEEAKEAPILAIETRDEVLDLVQQTRLSDSESWRKAVQSVQLNDRQYVQQIQEMLNSWRKQWADGNGMREACVFNFRTQHCIYYDLGI